MTNGEMNRAISKLAKQIEASAQNANYHQAKNDAEIGKDKEAVTKHFKFIENEAKREFIRLHNSSNDFSGMTRGSILNMIALNRKYRFLPIHLFGINVKTEAED